MLVALLRPVFRQRQDATQWRQVARFDGSYLFQDLCAGDYEIRAFSPTHVVPKVDVVTLEEGVRNLSITASPGAGITGVVQDAHGTGLCAWRGRPGGLWQRPANR